MKRYISLIALGLSLTLVVEVAAGQNQSSTSAQTPVKKAVGAESKNTDLPGSVKKDGAKEEAPDEAAIIRLQQRGLYLLKQAAEEAGSLSDGRQTARLQATVADQVWEYDSDTARKLFETAFDTVVKYYRDNRPANPISTGTEMGRRQGPSADARIEVIRLATKRDSALGQRFTDQYLNEKKRERQDLAAQNTPSTAYSSGSSNPTAPSPRAATSGMMGNVDSSANDLLSNAASMFKSDPRIGMQLAQYAFSTGIPTAAPSFLARLTETNHAAADQLYSIALGQLASSSASTPGQVLLLAAYPFGERQVWVTDGKMSMSMSFSVPKSYASSPPFIQQFLATAMPIISRAGEMDPAQSPDLAPFVSSALFAAKVLQPKVLAFQPALADNLANLTARLAQLTNPQAQGKIDETAQKAAAATASSSDSPNGAPGAAANTPGHGEDDVKKLLEKADNTADLAARDDIYMDASVMVEKLLDTDRAMLIAGKISDADFRATVKSWLSYEAASQAIKDKKYDEARRYAMDVIELDQSSYLFTQIAQAALKEKDEPRAIELLNEAARKANAGAESTQKVRSLLQIASIFSTFDSFRSFETVSDAVQAVNKVRDLKPDDVGSFTRTLKGKSGGTWMESSNGGGFDVSTILASLARTDFDRSLMLAQSLDNKQMKLSSVIAVAATALDKKKTP